MYDQTIITLILIVDLAMLYLMYKAELRKSSARTKRKFNKILQSVGLR